jgi:hypothetical protein
MIKQHTCNWKLNICWKEQCICLHLDWGNNTIDNLCCFLNPDEDICTVPSNRYSIVYCVVSSIQMKTYALFPPIDIRLSIVLFSQSRWRHMYCSLQQIFHCLQSNIYWREQCICLHLDWGNNTIDNWISVGSNSAYVFIWMEETTQ